MECKCTANTGAGGTVNTCCAKQIKAPEPEGDDDDDDDDDDGSLLEADGNRRASGRKARQPGVHHSVQHEWSLGPNVVHECKPHCSDEWTTTPPPGSAAASGDDDGGEGDKDD